jgi:hypothetical protein
MPPRATGGQKFRAHWSARKPSSGRHRAPDEETAERLAARGVALARDADGAYLGA